MKDQIELPDNPYKNNDAFMLMEYTCKRCGTVERIWNSRDAVTPFGVNCRCCNGLMNHTNWHNDRRVPEYKPPKGSRYFVDMTRDRAEEIAKKRIASFVGTEYEIPDGTDEYHEMVESLVLSMMEDCCSVDIAVAE